MTHLRLWWDATRTSLWFVPTLMTLAAVLLAVATLLLDARTLGMGGAPG